MLFQKIASKKISDPWSRDKNRILVKISRKLTFRVPPQRSASLLIPEYDSSCYSLSIDVKISLWWAVLQKLWRFEIFKIWFLIEKIKKSVSTATAWVDIGNKSVLENEWHLSFKMSGHMTSVRQPTQILFRVFENF